MDDPLNQNTVTKCREWPLFTCDRVQQMSYLDGLQIVKPETVSRRLAEQAIGRMLRSGQNSPKPNNIPAFPRYIQFQLVHPFLIENNRSIGAMQLQTNPILSTMSDPTGRQYAADPAPKSN